LTEPFEGWKQLLPPGRRPWRRRPGAYPIPAYSEFMPPPRLGRRAYGAADPLPLVEDDPWGWQVTEYEEAFELRPGLAHLAGELLPALQRLGRLEGGHGIGRMKLRGNPYWPEPLASAGAPPQERFVALLPLALARTQDDKGRVRWTLFGASEQGPARAFWRGFFTAPGREAPAAEGLAFCRRLLGAAPAVAGRAGAGAAAGAGVSAGADSATRELLEAGFRILPADGGALAALGPREGGRAKGGGGSDGGGSDGSGGASDGSGGEAVPVPEPGFWREEPLPSWTEALRWSEDRPLAGVRFLLTFRPFARLPEEVRRAYLAGELELLPFPGSLVFWGALPYRTLARELPLALQIPLLHPVERSEDPHRLRVPQSGWLHEPRPDQPQPETDHGPLRNTFRRTHRWERVERFEDALAVAGREDRTAHVLFSAAADDLGLYGKPMARNAQLWTHDYRLLLDGPRAGRGELAAAAERLAAGGSFGYRFLYPAMRVGGHEVYWHRPLAACLDPASGRPALVEGAPLGYLTAYSVERPDLERPVELWPRLLDRPAHRAAIEEPRRGEPGAAALAYRRAVNNARKLLEAWQLLGSAPLPPSFARALLRLPKAETLAAWLTSLEPPGGARGAARGGGGGAGAGDAAPAGGSGPGLAAELRARIAPEPARAAAAAKATKAAETTKATKEVKAASAAAAAPPLTFHRTANRRFEESYWQRIAFLAEGRFVNKDNADCVRDPVTLAQLRHRHRDLDAVAEYLLAHYRRLIAARGMQGQAAAGDLPFRWQTDFDFSWSGGWLGNQQGHLEERNVMLAIPGRDRSRAVIMADHYDTAYMEDRYGYQHGGHGPRLAAAGADDNHSATAALMLAAPIFLAMSHAGRLGCDVWLVHLTGEEFPSDCLGARHLAQSLVEGTLRLRTRPEDEAGAEDEGWIDLSETRVQGVYVLDMVAHNNDRDRDVFQICPGAGGESMWLALQAHLANHAWNRLAPQWNRRARRGCKRGRRSSDGQSFPAMALHPQLQGEVRPQIDPHSTLYNTDGQIFSDAGVPVVLFMENYDINRHGYHDSQDTMENIDLDYGAAVAAIAIEAVARAATEPPPGPA
jgi:Peptidase family M28